MTKLLLNHGADVNARAAWGWYTPLHLACKLGDEALIWLLLEHGAAWNAVDKERKTPLQWAARVGKASVAYRVDQVRALCLAVWRIQQNIQTMIMMAVPQHLHAREKEAKAKQQQELMEAMTNSGHSAMKMTTLC
ncbi:hypothetical protein PINS_up006929 [Pythium insidiosum]|nr:hypothetical protein PINS_up006929 [Pythium insidiosum]